MLGSFATASRFTLPFTRCRYCRTPPVHRCPRQRRRRQRQRQRVTEGTAMAPIEWAQSYQTDYIYIRSTDILQVSVTCGSVNRRILVRECIYGRSSAARASLRAELPQHVVQVIDANCVTDGLGLRANVMPV